METWLSSLPVGVAFGVLFLGAFLRGGATYWVGTRLRRGGEGSSWAARFDTPVVQRAERWVGRFGAPLVSLGFLTVGLQSAINLAAGLLRMPVRRFIPALVVGALAWATLYLTVGLAVIDAAIGRISWVWVLIAVAGVVLVSLVVSRFIRRRAEAAEVARS